MIGLLSLKILLLINGCDTALGVEGELKDLSRKIDVLNETISTFTCSNDNRVTYADKIKRNLLVIKSP